MTGLSLFERIGLPYAKYPFRCITEDGFTLLDLQRGPITGYSAWGAAEIALAYVLCGSAQAFVYRCGASALAVREGHVVCVVSGAEFRDGFLTVFESNATSVYTPDVAHELGLDAPSALPVPVALPPLPDNVPMDAVRVVPSAKGRPEAAVYGRATGYDEVLVVRYFDDELSFCPGDFTSMTADEAREYKCDVDAAYIRGTAPPSRDSWLASARSRRSASIRIVGSHCDVCRTESHDRRCHKCGAVRPIEHMTALYDRGEDVWFCGPTHSTCADNVSFDTSVDDFDY